jgi:RNase P subunit RPR2
MIDNAQQALSKVVEKNADLLKWAENIQITNHVEQKRVEELSAELKFARKQAVEQMNKILNPAKETVKNIMALFRPYISNMDSLIEKTDGALSLNHKRLIETTDEDIMARATEYHQRAKEAKLTGEIVPLPDLGVTPLPKTSHHNMGTTNYRTYVKVTVTQSNLVPREYCVPSETLLRKAGEIALAQKNPMPVVDGAIIEIKYVPVSRSA